MLNVIVLTVLFLVKKLEGKSYFFKSASVQFSHVWTICILKKQGTEVILVGWFSKWQSIKKVGGRRFAEGLYQALFSFRLARRNVIYKAKRKLSLISGELRHETSKFPTTQKFCFPRKCPHHLTNWVNEIEKDKFQKISNFIKFQTVRVHFLSGLFGLLSSRNFAT